MALTACAATAGAGVFEGKIEVLTTRGSETTSLRYTITTDFLRIEVTGSNAPDPIDVVDRKSGAVILLFPHNRTLVRLKAAGENPRAVGTGTSTMPPPSGLTSLPTMPIPISPTEKIELKATGQKQKILGYDCEKFEIKSRGETMEVWATDSLLPLPPYLRNQQTHFGPRLLEEQWAEPVAAKKLFPLRAILHDETPNERFRFEVKSITPEKIEDKDGKLFQPPDGYTEIQPLPF